MFRQRARYINAKKREVRGWISSLGETMGQRLRSLPGGEERGSSWRHLRHLEDGWTRARGFLRRPVPGVASPVWAEDQVASIAPAKSQGDPGSWGTVEQRALSEAAGCVRLTRSGDAGRGGLRFSL